MGASLCGAVLCGMSLEESLYRNRAAALNAQSQVVAAGASLLAQGILMPERRRLSQKEIDFKNIMKKHERQEVLIGLFN